MRGVSRTSGVFPHTHTGKDGGQSQPFAAAASSVLTMRSSSEWKEITASRPPGARWSMAARIMRETAVSSSLTAMRIAWKLRLAGCCFSRRAAAGIALRITSTSWSVVPIGAALRARSMAAAMAGA